MKVWELIEELQTLDPGQEAVVQYTTKNGQQYAEIEMLSEGYGVRDDRCVGEDIAIIKTWRGLTDGND